MMFNISSFKVVITCWILLASIITTSLADTDELQIFRIGTGGGAGTYYPIGGLIALAISNPPESLRCKDGGGCGVPNLLAAAQASNGSVANVRAIGDQTFESGLVQSDIAYWAYTGTGVFEGKKPIDSLRAIASLYTEYIHVVTQKNTGISKIKDLRGKRVSIDEPGSGTLVDSRLVLDAYDLSEYDFKTEYIKPEYAVPKIKEGLLDAFFIVAGYPITSVVNLAKRREVNLIPIDGPEREYLINKYSYFTADSIPADT